MYRIGMPIYFLAIVNSLVAKKIEPMPADLLGLIDNLLHNFRNALAEHIRNPRHFVTLKEEGIGKVWQWP